MQFVPGYGHHQPRPRWDALFGNVTFPTARYLSSRGVEPGTITQPWTTLSHQGRCQKTGLRQPDGIAYIQKEVCMVLKVRWFTFSPRVETRDPYPSHQNARASPHHPLCLPRQSGGTDMGYGWLVLPAQALPRSLIKA